jgi:hypothetical protein
MKILIAKQNEPIVKQLYPKANFREESKNTSSFNITPANFSILCEDAKIFNYNPYALFAWYYKHLYNCN